MASPLIPASLFFPIPFTSVNAFTRHHGLPVATERDYVFLSGLPRFLDLFDRWGIKATFFVVGSDLEDPEKAAILQRLVATGHEVSNHTMTHPASLSSMSDTEQEAEIGRCEERCEERLGIKPVGFRAPNFDIGEKTAAILNKRGYLYDSSVLAMPYGPLLRWCKGWVSGRTGKTCYLGRAAFVSAQR